MDVTLPMGLDKFMSLRAVLVFDLLIGSSENLFRLIVGMRHDT
jgi:hypothetical protein